MAVEIALLRAVNVGGNAILAMADFLAVAQAAGLTNVRTLLQSGNLIFDAGERAPQATEALLERSCKKAFDVTTDIHVRTPNDLQTIIDGNPFPKAARGAPGFLHVLFLRDAPAAQAYAALRVAIKGREEVRSGGRHAYIFYPDGAGRSKLTPAILKRHL